MAGRYRGPSAHHDSGATRFHQRPRPPHQQALPEFSAAILLCQDLLGLPCNRQGASTGTIARVAHILRFGKRLMTSNQCRPIRERFPPRDWFLNEFRLHSLCAYRLNLLERSLFRPRVVAQIRSARRALPSLCAAQSSRFVGLSLAPSSGNVQAGCAAQAELDPHRLRRAAFEV